MISGNIAQKVAFEPKDCKDDGFVSLSGVIHVTGSLRCGRIP